MRFSRLLLGSVVPGDAVQDAVHEASGVAGAESFGDLDGLVQNHFGGQLGLKEEFRRGNP
jgi:hypothetical protein